MPLRVPPVDGESFPSYVERLAADLGVTVVEALAATGVIDRVHAADLPYFAGFTLLDERIDAFARNTRLPRDRLESMFVRRYADVLGWHDFHARPGFRRLMQARRLGVVVRSSNLCPDCIADDNGAWQVSWMLVWSFACLRHRRLLTDVCPSCQTFLGYGANHAVGFLSFPSLPPVPGRCGNSVPSGTGQSGRASRPCGQALDAIETVALDPGSPLLTAQRLLESVLEGHGQRVDGEEVSAGDYLRELRTVATLLLWTRSSDQYDTMPAPIAPALEQDFAGLDNNRRWLRDLGTRPGRVLRTAGIVTRAVSLLDAPATSTLAERLEPILHQAQNLGNHHRYPSELRTRLPPSRLIDTALQICEAPTVRSAWRTATARHASARSSSTPLRVDQVPQLFWHDLYQTLFKGLVTEIRDDPFRRFCSLTLVKIAGDVTWAAACEHLDLDARGAKSQIGCVRSTLLTLGNTEVFHERMSMIANALANAEDRVNYAERRRRLSDLHSRPEQEWLAICADAGLIPPGSERRRRNVATWIWCHLTSGDYRRSPAFRDRYNNYDQTSYVNFRSNVLPKVTTQLQTLADRILSERGLRSSIESWRSDISGFSGAKPKAPATTT